MYTSYICMEFPQLAPELHYSPVIRHPLHACLQHLHQGYYAGGVALTQLDTGGAVRCGFRIQSYCIGRPKAKWIKTDKLYIHYTHLCLYTISLLVSSLLSPRPFVGVLPEKLGVWPTRLGMWPEKLGILSPRLGAWPSRLEMLSCADLDLDPSLLVFLVYKKGQK